MTLLKRYLYMILGLKIRYVYTKMRARPTFYTAAAAAIVHLWDMSSTLQNAIELAVKLKESGPCLSLNEYRNGASFVMLTT